MTPRFRKPVFDHFRIAFTAARWIIAFNLRLAAGIEVSGLVGLEIECHEQKENEDEGEVKSHFSGEGKRNDEQIAPYLPRFVPSCRGSIAELRISRAQALSVISDSDAASVRSCFSSSLQRITIRWFLSFLRRLLGIVVSKRRWHLPRY